MCIISSCQVTGNSYYGIMAVPAPSEGGVELITMPLGPKHNARPTCSVNSDYADALWSCCTADALRKVVRSINPDKFQMTTGAGTSETAGRKRKAREVYDHVPPPEQTLIVTLQSDVATLKKEKVKLAKKLEKRQSTIAEKDEVIAKQKEEIGRLKKDLKTAKNAKKPKSIPKKCPQCEKRARDESSPDNRRSAKQQSQQSGPDIVQVLVAERDKNDKLVMDLTSQLANTLKEVVKDVVQGK